MQYHRVELYLWVRNDNEVVSKHLLNGGNLEEPQEFSYELVPEIYCGLVEHTDMTDELEALGIKKFIPAQKLTAECKDGIVSVVMWHNKTVHDTIFLSDSEYVMAPQGALREQLNELYESYGLSNLCFL